MPITSAKTLVDTQSGLIFAKSPRWFDQQLIFLDIYDRCIKSVAMNGEVRTVRALSYLPGALSILADGRMIVGDALRRKLFLLETTSQTQVADLNSVSGFALGDAIIDSRGGIYVTIVGFNFLDPLVDPIPNGVIVYVRMDGSSSVVADGLFLPSGLIVTPDNKTLVVAETLGHRLTTFDIEDDGSLENRRLWAQFQDDIRPAGICIDSENAIWVAGSISGTIRVREGGQVDHQITTERPAFAVTIGGPELKHLFVCTSAASDPAVIRRRPRATIDMAEIITAGADFFGSRLEKDAKSLSGSGFSLGGGEEKVVFHGHSRKYS